MNHGNKAAMENRELLELVAKAASVEIAHWGVKSGIAYVHRPSALQPGSVALVPWNPLIDDGDALRLAVKLGISIKFWPDGTQVTTKRELGGELGWADCFSCGPEAAARLAIVLAAAEIENNIK